VITVYTYANCDTCRRAAKWLRSKGIDFEERPIRETPPSVTELKAMLAAQGGDVRKLFNTSGKDYRELGLGEKFASFKTTEALNLLSTNGNLVKRPFVIGKTVGLVGFNEAAWSAALQTK
jgi:arsenate reductase